MGNNNLNFYLNTLHCNCSFSTTTSFPFAHNMLCLFAILFPKTIPIRILQFKFLMFVTFGHRPILHILLRRSTEFLNRILALQSKAARQFLGARSFQSTLQIKVLTNPLLTVFWLSEHITKSIVQMTIATIPAISRAHHDEHSSHDYCYRHYHNPFSVHTTKSIV